MKEKKNLKKLMIFAVVVTMCLSALAFLPTASAATINVPGDYSTIQAAINAASDGDEIIIAAGTYIETINLNGKELTIDGAGVGSTIINASGFSVYAISNFGDNSTFKDVTLIGSSNYGFKVSHVSNITLENIRVEDSGKTGVDLHTIDTAILSNIVVVDTVGGFGIMVLDSNNISISDITTSNNPWGGVSIQAVNENAENIDFSGSFDADEPAPLLFEQDPPYGDFINVDIPDEFDYVVYGLRTGIWNYKQWYYQETLTDAKTFANGMMISGFPYENMIIYNVPIEDNYYVIPGMLIQDAIDASSNADIINIDTGTYNENILVNKRLSFIGTGSSTSGTIITQNAAGAGDSDVGVVQITASGLSDTQPILFKDIRVEPISLAGFSVGLFCEDTATIVEYIKLDNVRVIGTNTNPSTEQERGLYVDTTSSLSHLTVVDSSFDDLTYGWYLHKQVSADTSTVQYVSVSDTTFNHNNHKGIYAEKLSDATFTDCSIEENGFDSSVLPSHFAPWSAGIDINLKSGTYENFVFDTCVFTDNAIDESKEGVGLTVKERGTGNNPSGGYTTYPAHCNEVLVTECTFTNNERGMRFGEPGKENLGPTNVTIEDCNIVGNVQHYSGIDGSAYGGLINQMQAEIIAECNWYNDISGPSGDGPGTGDAVQEVVGSIDYIPWLDDEYPYGDCVGGLCADPVWVDDDAASSWYDWDHVLTIQTAVDRVCEGGTVYVAAGTYDEAISIDKSLTIIGSGDDQTFIKSTAKSSPLMTVSANDVTIQDIELTDDVQLVEGISIVSGASSGLTVENVDFNNLGNSGTNAYGINIHTSFTGLSVIDSDFIAMVHTSSSRGIGIFAGNSFNLNDFEVTGSTFDRLFVGIYLSSAIDGLDVIGNTFGPFQLSDCVACVSGVYIGDGDDENFDIENVVVTDNLFTEYGRGVYVWNYGCNATIGSFEIYENIFTNSIWSSSVRFIGGIGHDENISFDGPIEIDDNIITQNSDVGANVAMIDFRTYCKLESCEIAVTNNEITFSGGAYDDAMYGIKLSAWEGPFTNTIVENNNLNGGNTTGAGEVPSSGIVINHKSDLFWPSDVLEMDIIGNDITGFDNGVCVYDTLYDQYGSLPTGSILNVNYNNIYGNALYGLRNDNGEIVDATCNWWGDITGPTQVSNPSGIGDQVSDNVTFLPWLDDEYPYGDCVGGLTIELDINQSFFSRGFPIRHAIDGDWAGAQSYLPTKSVITSVDIYLRKFGNPEFDLIVELRENSPTGTLLDTVTITNTSAPSGWTWLNIDFEDTTVTPGTDYLIVCPPAPSGVTTSFGYEWGYAFGNQYNDGSFWFTRDSGGLWRDLPTMYEFTFKTYGY